MLLTMMITPSCDTITKHISQSMDEKLTFFKRIRMRLHLLGCHLCKRYENQLALLREAVIRLHNDEDAQIGINNESQLSENKKDKMKKVLYSPN